MKRRTFLGGISVASGGLAIGLPLIHVPRVAAKSGRSGSPNQWRAEVLVLGGGLGGCAAVVALLENGRRVIWTEETDWIGGQSTSQAVPPDENRWIETHGSTRRYREYRDRIRAYYREHYPLTAAARANPHLNPGNGSVSRLCHEPGVALAVLRDWIAPYLSSGQLTLLTEHRPVAAEVVGDKIRSVEVEDLREGKRRVLEAPWIVDATELGDLLALGGIEHVIGSEGRKETGELHASEEADPMNQQAFTVCFAMDYRPGEEHVIEKPARYEFWKNYVPSLEPSWPGRLLDLTYTHPASLQPKRLGFNPGGPDPRGALNLWIYRRLIDHKQFREGFYPGDTSLVNWPQNDYMPGPLVGVSAAEKEKHLEGARQLSLSLLYWLQTEVPRPDDGQGYPGLRLRGDLLGGPDGLAKYPYVREARRIRAVTTVLESHCGRENRARELGVKENEVEAKVYPDRIGIGHYQIDLHPSTAGDNYIDFPALPFQIPLGALLPVRVENVVAACKNIGTTHVTNGCYRLHPVEWNIGEAAGLAVSEALKRGETVRAIRSKEGWLRELQEKAVAQGFEVEWRG